jgi:hypothetical protein
MNEKSFEIAKYYILLDNLREAFLNRFAVEGGHTRAVYSVVKCILCLILRIIVSCELL